MSLNFVKVLLAAAAASLACGSTASAADMAVKAPRIAPPIAAFSWTGCYIGGDVGHAWARDRDDETVTATGAPSGFSPAGAANLNGWKLGGYLGCNYQISQFVIGVEGDGEWANMKGSAIFSNAGADFYDATIKRQASARGRIGYAFDRVLVYATGGAAFAHINEHDVDFTGSGLSNDNSTTRTGWTAGAGVDYAFTNNWIGRVEYRHADFGKFSYNPTVFVGFTENHRITENAVRFGLAYKF